MNKGILFFCLMVITISSFAQQDAMYTHYSFNMLTVNPAYAGSRNAMTLTALHRSQWVGFDGAPITESFTIHSPTKKSKMGFGLSFLNDKIGPINNTSLFGSYAYKLKFKTAGVLSMGVSAGFNLLQANVTGLSATDQNDVTIASNTRNQFSPNFGIGFYYTYKKYFIGLSSPMLMKNKINPNSPTGYGLERRHIYISGGVVLPVNSMVMFRPTLLVKMTQAAPVQADLTAMFIFDKKLELGASFRTGDAISALIGINVLSNLRVGYSYDFSYGLNVARANIGSHELMLRYDFITKARKRIVSPRYF